MKSSNGCVRIPKKNLAPPPSQIPQHELTNGNSDKMEESLSYEYAEMVPENDGKQFSLEHKFM